MQMLIKERIEKAINERVFPGCVVGFVLKNGERCILPFGRHTYSQNARPIRENSIFDVASITKSIPTSSAALKLIDESRLKIDDKLIRFLPEFGGRYREMIKIGHLLTHTLDFRFKLSEHKEKPPQNIINIILNADFNSAPGTSFSLSNGASILLGMVVERISGRSLDLLAEDYFFSPLEMHQTTFSPLRKFDKDEIVPSEFDLWRDRVIQGEIHDESASVLSKIMVPGSAGLFSTAPDLLTFLEMLLNEGALKGKTYFSKQTINLIHSNQLNLMGEFTGLGWELYRPRYMGDHCSVKTFGKTGFTGCVCICDIVRGVGITHLSNFTYPRRKSDKESINSVRRDIADIIFKNMNDFRSEA